LLLLLLILILISACSSAPTATPFIPPTNQAPLIEPTLIFIPTPAATVQILEFPLPTILPTVDQSDCINNLSFIEDVTVPDNSFVSFGASIDKQWLVENNGTCNWNSQYRLRHIDGAGLGAPEEMALFPARSGIQVTIQITFTAPFEEGVYESAWQAFDPSGFPFGDLIYVRILATP
jgi:Ig-like domain from next to BRCA1 gene